MLIEPAGFERTFLKTVWGMKHQLETGLVILH